MTSTDTGRLGDSTKLNVLSAGRPSVPARMTPRMLASDTVMASNVTAPDAFGAIVTSRDATGRPSISRRTGTLVTGVALRLVRPAVIVTRSSVENDARLSETDDTDRLVSRARP